MRLQPADIATIRQVTQDVLGYAVPIRLFGSRLNDDARGGDVDLFLELDKRPDNPAWLAATLSGKISRRMRGRKIDVLIAGPRFAALCHSRHRPRGRGAFVRPDDKTLKRLAFLYRVVNKESRLLLDTRQRLFKPGFNLQSLVTLDSTPDLADRIESFVARFGRLQDTTGDKLLPQVLAALGERVASFADNLDRAEKLGWIASADDWFAMCTLRNQMVHEYVEDPVILWNALDAGQRFTPPLAQAAHAMCQEMVRRSWVSV